MKVWVWIWVILLLSSFAAAQERRVIEITADHDSRYRVEGHASPTVTVEAGEPLLLRITAVKAKSMNRDGSVHGFVLMNKNGDKVPGWNLFLHPGTAEFELVAPDVPGDYDVVCSVICSHDHEQMHMKFRVVPKKSAGATQ